MRSFNFTNKLVAGTSGDTDNWAVKLYGEAATVSVAVTAVTGSVTLAIYVAPVPVLASFKEIVKDNVQVTRMTFTGAGTDQKIIHGLTPGTFIAVGVAAGTGTFTWGVVTSNPF